MQGAFTPFRLTIMPTIDDLDEAVRNRQCVLFLGAGVHYPPPPDSLYSYAPQARPPIGAAYSCALVNECVAELNRKSQLKVPASLGLTDEQRVRRDLEETIAEETREKERVYLERHRENLQRSSWYYEVRHGRDSLVKKTIKAVDTEKEPSAIVRALAEIDFPIVITTNYDRLFEKALRSCNPGKEPAVRIYDPDGQMPTKNFLGLPKANERWLFKMHGCVSQPDSLVITDEDYINFVMRMGDSEDYHPVPQKIRVQFKEWPTLFVGYSLLDYNLRLLFRTLRRRVDKSERPPTFALDPVPDLLVVETYGPSGLVSFIEQDSWRFVPELYQRIFNRAMTK